MSVAAINPESSLDLGTCAARLIPGQRQVQATHRKRPHSVDVDGRVRSLTHTLHGATCGSVITRFILPAPFATNDPHRLYPLVVFDSVLILIGWMISGILESWLRANNLQATGMIVATPLLPRSAANGLLFAVIATLLSYSEGLYLRTRERSAMALLAKSLGWTTVISGSINYLSGSSQFSLACLLLSSLLGFAGVAGRRAWCEHLRANAKSDPLHTHNVLIVGANAAGRDLALYLEQHPELGRTFRGFLDDKTKHGFGVLGAVAEMASIARSHFIDEIILVPTCRPDLVQNVIREARDHHLDVRVATDVYDCKISPQWMETVGSLPLVTVHEERLPRLQLGLKRVMDVVLSLGVLVFTAPVSVLVACLIKLDSPGPLLYSAPRVGRKGRRFRCHKFRTMVANAAAVKEELRSQNQRQGPCFKIEHDPRITRVGRWLRRYSLDELPQLWNVFRGEMSLVGPRPHPLDDFARYELGHLRRLDVMPGITGLWQVTARRSPSFQTNLALDLEYIQRWSLWMDLSILFKTIAVVCKGTGV